MFVSLGHPSGINPLHVVMINQRSQNRFYGGAAALGEHARVIRVAV